LHLIHEKGEHHQQGEHHREVLVAMTIIVLEGVLPVTVRNVYFFQPPPVFFDPVPLQNDRDRCGLISKTAFLALLLHLQSS
jgi:hypothetical protein